MIAANQALGFFRDPIDAIDDEAGFRVRVERREVKPDPSGLSRFTPRIQLGPQRIRSRLIDAKEPVGVRASARAPAGTT